MNLPRKRKKHVLIHNHTPQCYFLYAILVSGHRLLSDALFHCDIPIVVITLVYVLLCRPKSRNGTNGE